MGGGQTVLQTHRLLFVNCYYYVYIYFPKYKLLSPCTIISMDIFRADHLAQDNQFVCSSPEKTISPTPSFSHLYCVQGTLQKWHAEEPEDQGFAVK